MKILLTGAAGFLGSALAAKLSESGYDVAILVRRKTNLYRLSNQEKYQIARCDSEDEIQRFISLVQPNVVFHLACCYGRHGESISQMMESNIHYGLTILNVIKSLNARVAFLNIGSAVSKGVSLYALTKSQFEELGLYFANHLSNNINFLNIKLQHVYGPGDDISKFTSYVINACEKNVDSIPLSPGEQVRDFIYIDDAVDAFLVIIENLEKLSHLDQLQVGSGVAISLKDFVELVKKCTGSKTILNFGEMPYRPNEDLHLVADTTALKMFGWKPKFNLEIGISEMIKLEGHK